MTIHIGRELGEALAEMRADAISRMRATCIITRPTGKIVTDLEGNDTREMVQVYPDPSWTEEHPHADGKCYLRYPGLAHEQSFDSQGTDVSQSRIVLRVPFGPVFRPGDVATITSDADTPHLTGTALRVASVDDQSQATAQRLLCEDNQSGVSHA